MPLPARSSDDSDDDADDADDSDDEALARDSDDTSESSGSGEQTHLDERERDEAYNSDEEARLMRVGRLQSLETLGGASASSPGVGSSQPLVQKKKKTRGRARADDGTKRLKWGPNLPVATYKGGK